MHWHLVYRFNLNTVVLLTRVTRDEGDARIGSEALRRNLLCLAHFIAIVVTGILPLDFLFAFSLHYFKLIHHIQLLLHVSILVLG